MLNKLLDPLTEDDFFSKYWGSKPYVCTKKTLNSEAYSNLLSVKEIDQLISSQESLNDWLQIVKPDASVNTKNAIKQDNTINMDFIYQAYAEGYTLLLTKVHAKHPKIGQLCRDLEEIFLKNQVLLSSQIRANVYLTPKASSGFPVHYDNHDVMIIQVSGEKLWKIYNSPEPYPNKRYDAALANNSNNRELILEHEFKMSPGNWIYIPRGYYHKAHTEENYSLHVTISLNPYTWGDIIRKVAENRMEFRKPLEFLVEEGNSQNIVERFKELGMIGDDEISQIINQLIDKQFRELHQLPDEIFKSINLLDNISENTIVTLRKGALLKKEKVNEGYKLFCGGMSPYHFMESYLELLDFLIKNNTFKISELPSTNLKNKIELMRNLIQDGLFVICQP